MIVEHPFGTIKRVWDAGYYLTRLRERNYGNSVDVSLTTLSGQ